MDDRAKIEAAWQRHFSLHWDFNNGPCTVAVWPDLAAPDRLEDQNPPLVPSMHDVVTFRREAGTIEGKPAQRFIGSLRGTELVMQEDVLR